MQVRSLAYSLETNAPFSPSWAGTAGEPTCHFTLITLLMSAETPLTLISPPNVRPCPARTPETTSTPGTFRNSCAEAIETGEKLFVAVSA